jgi:hypothetical protein
MQNRLDGAAEAQAASEKQLAELHSAIAAERAARPESVNFSYSFSVYLWFFYMSVSHRFRINAVRHWLDWLLRGKRSLSCKVNSRRTARATPLE